MGGILYFAEDIFFCNSAILKRVYDKEVVKIFAKRER